MKVIMYEDKLKLYLNHFSLFLWLSPEGKEYSVKTALKKEKERTGKERVELRAVNLSTAGKREFIRGFLHVCPKWYSTKVYNKKTNKKKWEEPWTFANHEDWFIATPQTSPFRMGEFWAKKVSIEMNQEYEKECKSKEAETQNFQTM